MRRTLSLHGRTVEVMHLSEPDWDCLSQHVGTRQRLPPRAVYFAVAALAPIDEIVASWASADMPSETPTSGWSNWIVTSTLIGHTELTFGAPFYDAAEEADSFHSEVTIEVGAAWVRPLSSIVELGFGNVVSMVVQSPVWWSAATAGKVKFADGTHISLPEPTALYQPAERERWDQFVEAIRSSIV